jgi:hypothetical protein
MAMVTGKIQPPQRGDTLLRGAAEWPGSPRNDPRAAELT